MIRVALLLLLVALPSRGGAGEPLQGPLPGLTVWAGDVRVEGDVWVPPGSRLVIEAGTRVRFAEALSTKTDPVFWHPGTELAVGGELEVRGTPGSPVVFEGEGAWGGIVAAPGAGASLRHAMIRGAREALLCVGSRCDLEAVEVDGAAYGIVTGPGASVEAEAVRLTGCGVGVLEAGAPGPEEVTITAPADARRLSLPAGARSVAVIRTPEPAGPPVEYVGEYTVMRPETWSGDVIITGRVTVVPEAVLTLAPGTRVRFRKVDENRDGLGEGGLLVLGGIRSLGTPGRPVVFESAEPAPAPGDWDKVSLIASEDPENRFEYTVFRHGVQALHAHFSRLTATGCLFEGNLRALQFQESEETRIAGCVFVGNKQALRFRDSTVEVTGSRFVGNLYGVHAFRATLDFVGNVLEGNALGGFLAKESRVRLVGNRVGFGRDGARFRNADSPAEIRGNRFENLAEDGLSLSRTDARVVGNLFDRAGLDLVAVELSDVVLRANRLGTSGRHALHLKGARGVDARGNYWEGDVPARIYDREDRPDLGAVAWRPELTGPPPPPPLPKAW